MDTERFCCSPSVNKQWRRSTMLPEKCHTLRFTTGPRPAAILHLAGAPVSRLLFRVRESPNYVSNLKPNKIAFEQLGNLLPISEKNHWNERHCSRRRCRAIYANQGQFRRPKVPDNENREPRNDNKQIDSALIRINEAVNSRGREKIGIYQSRNECNPDPVHLHVCRLRNENKPIRDRWRRLK